MNIINNAVQQYGLKPVVAAAVVVGLISYPIVKKVSLKAIEIFSAIVKWINDSTFFVRVRSLGCDICSEHHRVHMSTMGIIHGIHERDNV